MHMERIRGVTGTGVQRGVALVRRAQQDLAGRATACLPIASYE